MKKIRAERTAKAKVALMQRIFPEWKPYLPGCDNCPRCKDKNHIHEVEVPVDGGEGGYGAKLTCSSCGAEGSPLF